MRRQTLLVLFLLIGFVGLCGFNWPSSQFNNNLNSSWVDRETQLIGRQAPSIDSAVLRLSLQAYLKAQQKGVANKNFLTVIDYSKPSTERRLWVFDLQNGKTLFNTWVSHGKNSGGVISNSFSNANGSLKSSIGVFVTDSTYIGGNGYSLRLRGLERGVNDNAYRRFVVIHGAQYVNADIIKRSGQIGRSWGCPAVSKSLSTPLINTIKDRSLVFAYYPDKTWLRQSQYLAG